MILAGIDIGTNSLRLLVAETGPDSIHPIFSDRRTTRLGKDLDRTGRLSREAEERSIAALVEFAEGIRRSGACRTAVIGTSALRNAANTSDFIKAVKERSGLDIRVISGEEEAKFTLCGVREALNVKDLQKVRDTRTAALVIDIGGGSTEIIMDRPGADPVVASLSLGAVYLAEGFIKHDPPLVEELESLKRMVRTELADKTGMIRADPAGILIGTAGTISTLVAIDQGLAEYDTDKINRAVLTRTFVDKTVQKLSAYSIAERRTIRGLEPGREDIILTGAVVAQEIMIRFGHDSMLVSEWGLREGIILDLYENIVKHDSLQVPMNREQRCRD